MEKRKHKNSFKEMIVGLLNSGMLAKQVSKDYDLNIAMIGRWKREFNARGGDFSKRKEVSHVDLELRSLKKQLRDVTMERDILKKAVSIFSKSDR